MVGQQMSVEAALLQAGTELQRKFGTQPISRRDLTERVMELSNCSYDSVLPSDYSYNLVNRAPISCSNPIFVHEGHGKYRFVGRGHPYSGNIVWHPVGSKAKVVGSWRNGKSHFVRDPRSAA